MKGMVSTDKYVQHIGEPDRKHCGFTIGTQTGHILPQCVTQKEDGKGLLMQWIWCMFWVNGRHWEESNTDPGHGPDEHESDKGVGDCWTLVYNFKLEVGQWAS